MLATPQEVIHRAGVAMRPEYEDVSPMDDCAGFYAYRRYPASTELAKIVTDDGRSAVRCYMSFAVHPPAEGSHVSRVEIRTWLAGRWNPNRPIASNASVRDPYEPWTGHPDAPTPQSALILARTPKPIHLDETDVQGLIYDSQEDAFFDGDGNVVTPVQILDETAALSLSQV